METLANISESDLQKEADYFFPFGLHCVLSTYLSDDLLFLQLFLYHIKMAYCGSVCNVPCGLGSCYGGLTSGRLWPSYGLGSLSGMGTCSGLGAMSGANVACSEQLPGSEVVIQPPPSVVTIPGPVLSATSEPAAVAQTTYSGLGAQGLSPLYSGGALGGYGRSGLYSGGLYGSGLYGSGLYGSGLYGGGSYGSGLYGGGLYGSGLYGGGLYGGLRRYGQRCLPFSGWSYGACGPCGPC